MKCASIVGRYSMGVAAGTGDPVGRLMGIDYTDNEVNSSFWDFVDKAANGTEDVWWILEGQNYPKLWWELADGILDE